MARYLGVMILVFAAAATAAPQRGFNLLQLPAATFEQPAAAESMRRMAEAGSNAVILVPFLQQGRAGSAEIGFSDAVTDRQLHVAIENARRLGLGIILKPQILVDDGWAGDIKFGSDADEERWFERYRDLIGYYARLAERERVDTFVIGTELSGVETSARWRDVIASVRAVFHGTLTYAAHGVKGVKRFSAWRELDAIGVNLYPKLGDSADKSSVRARMDQTVKELKKLTREILRPVWVLEVGIPSVQGALESPWDWRRLSDTSSVPEPALQGMVLGQWLEALEKPWIDAVFIWCWYSDPYAGGMDDIDYTLQNKPAELEVKCRWTAECGGVRK
jgi:hypothetical protein